MKVGIRGLQGAVGILFLWCAAVQFNDPDPLPWVAGYGLAATVFGFAVFDRRSTALSWLSLGVLCALALFTLPGFRDFMRLEAWGNLTASMDTSRPHIELAREFLGAVTASAAVIALLLTTGSRSRR